MTSIRIGTTGATLAQAESISASLAAEPAVEVVTNPLAALAAGECDLAVGAAEQLAVGHAGVSLAAVWERADARDALCAHDGLTLDTLPPGARVGADSALRRAQLAQRGLDIEIVAVSGDAEQQLGRVASGELDAVVLPVAALERADRADAATELFSLSDWPTAPGQGAVVVHSRTGEERLAAKLGTPRTRTAVAAELGLFTELAPECASPIAASAFVEDGLLFLTGSVYAADGGAVITASHAGYVADLANPAVEIAQRVATELRELGAASLGSDTARERGQR